VENEEGKRGLRRGAGKNKGAGGKVGGDFSSLSKRGNGLGEDRTIALSGGLSGKNDVKSGRKGGKGR